MWIYFPIIILLIIVTMTTLVAIGDAAKKKGRDRYPRDAVRN